MDFLKNAAKEMAKAKMQEMTGGGGGRGSDDERPAHKDSDEIPSARPAKASDDIPMARPASKESDDIPMARPASKESDDIPMARPAKASDDIPMARPAGSSEVISASSLAFEEHAPAQDHEVQEANEAHDKVYNQSTYVTDEEAGKAAGAQAFKKAEAKAEETGGSVDKSDLATNAMAEVMKLIQGGKGGDDKSAMLKNAVTTAMKLFAAKKMAGGNVSEGGSNPLESLMGNPAVAGALSNPAVAGLLGKFMGGGKD